MKIGKREINLLNIKSIEELVKPLKYLAVPCPTEVHTYRIHFRWKEAIQDEAGDSFYREYVDVDVFTGVELLHKWATYRFDEIANASDGSK